MTIHRSLDMTESAGRALVDCLVAQGVEHVFCVPGESFLGVLDALRDSEIKLTVCRQEGAAAMMAEAAGKASGRPGVCFVTRAPGATNASAGIHVAAQDSTPLILFVGQVERKFRGRDAWQEMDYGAFFGGVAKWAAEIEDASRLEEHVRRAFTTAMAGRPGPVVLALPADMLGDRVATHPMARIPRPETPPGEKEMSALEDEIARAARPMLLLGGGGWNAEARADFARFAERFAMPVMTSYRRAPLFDALHPNYAGDLGLGPNPALIARVKASDLFIAVGARLSQVATQNYTLFGSPAAPAPMLVHAYPGAEEIGRVFAPHLAIHATPASFARALAKLSPRGAPRWAAETAVAHGEYLVWSEAPVDQPGPVNLSEIVIWLRENLPRDAILCNGAGNYASWIHRFYRFREAGTHFAPTSASMGYGMPAAVAMKRLYPARRVISINGDGDFLMNGQEFATAVQYGLAIIVIILDNAMYGTIRMHQERAFPGRVAATDLVNPDFAATARSFGGFGVTVERTADFPAAFRAAEGSGLPAIIHVKYDGEGILPGMTLGTIRDQAPRRT